MKKSGNEQLDAKYKNVYMYNVVITIVIKLINTVIENLEMKERKKIPSS